MILTYFDSWARPPMLNKHIKSRGVPRQATLATLKYTADERAGGWDTVQVSIGSNGAQRGEVPLYIVRKAGGERCPRSSKVHGAEGPTLWSLNNRELENHCF